MSDQIIGQIIAACITGFFSLITTVTATILGARLREPESANAPVNTANTPNDSSASGGTPRNTRPSGKLLALAGVYGAIAFFMIALVAFLSIRVFINRPDPTVTIEDPTPGGRVEAQLENTGAVRFSVSGSTSGVVSGSAEYDFIPKVYVLVQPGGDPQWRAQPGGTIGPDGKWFSPAWYGSNEYPPKQGETISIVVIVANPKDVEQGRRIFSNPQDARPLAQSGIIRITIDRILQ